MASSRHARMMRMAISPRLAISTLRNMSATDCTQNGSNHDRVRRLAWIVTHGDQLARRVIGVALLLKIAEHLRRLVKHAGKHVGVTDLNDLALAVGNRVDDLPVSHASGFG